MRKVHYAKVPYADHRKQVMAAWAFEQKFLQEMRGLPGAIQVAYDMWDLTNCKPEDLKRIPRYEPSPT